jgi:hypothetical protein
MAVILAAQEAKPYLEKTHHKKGLAEWLKSAYLPT